MGVTKKDHWSDKLNLSTAQGLEDFEIICGLAHDPDLVWLSAARVSSRSGVAVDSVAATLERLVLQGIVMRHPSRPELYGEACAVRLWLPAAMPKPHPSAA